MASIDERTAPRLRTREDLLQLIRANEDVTRAELVELTRMSRSTVNQAVGRLLADGRITESEARAQGRGSGSGRPATRLRAVADGAPVAGIDFGHNHVHVAVADALGKSIADERVSLDVDLRATDAMDVAVDLLEKIRRDQGIDQLSTLVAGIPGPLDTRTGLVRSPTILSSWVGLAPADELRARLHDVEHVHVENDAVLGAYGELRAGAGRYRRAFLYVKASHGIGAGLVIDGAPFKGANGLAGEIGHTNLPGHTEICRCGNRGCLEAVVSVQALMAQLVHTHPTTDPAQITLSTFDDGITRRLLDEAGRELGRVLASLCNLLNPDALVVGGELAAAGSSFLEGVEQAVLRHTQPATAAALEIMPAHLGIRAEVTGALQMAAAAAVR
ncbi:ROK family transcriptional regulator [Cellulomonas sp. JH27-2]|uniref:ROK family transcriptional regulator n=1 Tax=Cellulomonas sp. JH27-2 TaxID=2774139 RepID=UPI00177BDA1B|nr:ROK family transcriptional regulator [Cellulomonas sp. JH27-2]MBD8059723.1 ROK family transcriptional regulator [Cellulomonas sp. JH27-2]